MKKKNKPMVYFAEIQHIKRFWILILLLFEIVFFTVILYRQIFMDKAFGPYPVTNNGLIVLSILFILPVLLLFFVKIEITVSSKNIRYKMIPLGLFQYRIPQQQLKSFSIKKKKTGNHKAASGVLLNMRKEKKLFLPSQKPGELFQAIQKMMGGN